MADPVVHFEIVGKDTAKLGGFYSGLFGWKIDHAPMPGGGTYGLIEAAGRGIGGGLAAQEGHSMVTIYIEVDSPAAYLERIVAAGGTILMPETTIPNMVTFALFADPEGHTIGLVKSEVPG